MRIDWDAYLQVDPERSSDGGIHVDAEGTQDLVELYADAVGECATSG